MSLSRNHGRMGVVAVAVMLVASPAVLADGGAHPMAKPLVDQPGKFKLHVQMDRFPTEMIAEDGFKLPQKVDSKLIQQINGVRLALPSWHGFHGLTPGASGASQ